MTRSLPDVGAHGGRAPLLGATSAMPWTCDQVWFGHGDRATCSTRPVPYPAMTDTVAAAAPARRLRLAGHRLRRDNVPLAPVPRAASRCSRSGRPTGHALAQGGQQLDAQLRAASRTPAPRHRQLHRPEHSGAEVGRRTRGPRTTWSTSPATRASPTCSSRATRSRPRPTRCTRPRSTTARTPTPTARPDSPTTGTSGRAGPRSTADRTRCRRPTWPRAPSRSVHPQVAGLTSTDPAGNEITFSWTDYWETNQEQPWAQTGEVPNQSAKQYRIEVDDDASFAGDLDRHALVDQPTYTAFDRLYPEGTLFWRVQAVDSDDNGLAWSETSQYTFTKQSPQVQLTSPISNATVAGTTPSAGRPRRSPSPTTSRSTPTTTPPSRPPTRSLRPTGVRNAAYVPIDTLPVSTEFYLWRVRRTDADGNKGPWSTPAGSRSPRARSSCSRPPLAGPRLRTVPCCSGAGCPAPRRTR